MTPFIKQLCRYISVSNLVGFQATGHWRRCQVHAIWPNWNGCWWHFRCFGEGPWGSFGTRERRKAHTTQRHICDILWHRYCLFELQRNYCRIWHTNITHYLLQWHDCDTCYTVTHYTMLCADLSCTVANWTCTMPANHRWACWLGRQPSLLVLT